MNHLMNAIKAAAAVIILAAAAFLFLPVHESGRVLIEIKEGTAGKAAADTIAQSSGVSVRTPFIVSYAVCSRLYGSAKPGCYRFHNASAYSMMKALCRGRTEVFTVADGMTVSVIADALVRLYHLPPDDPFIENMISEKTRYEGKLFPATYPVLTLKPEDLIHAMLKKFARIEKEYGFMHDELVIASDYVIYME